MHKNELEVKTKNGHKVIAPLGASFVATIQECLNQKKMLVNSKLKIPSASALHFLRCSYKYLDLKGYDLVQNGLVTCSCQSDFGLAYSYLFSLPVFVSGDSVCSAIFQQWIDLMIPVVKAFMSHKP